MSVVRPESLSGLRCGGRPRKDGPPNRAHRRRRGALQHQREGHDGQTTSVAFAAVAALGTVGLGHGGPALAQSEVVLKAADVHPLGYPTVEAVMWMGEELEQRTDGRLSVEMYPSMQLGGEKEMIEQAQVGAVALARISVGPMGPLVPELNVFNLPYLFRDAAHMEAVIDGHRRRAAAEGDRPSDGGPRRPVLDERRHPNVYNSKHPVRSMADLQGLKIRMMGNPIFVDTMNAMGGNGVSMGFDQLINGLQTGVVDGAENNYPTYSSGQHYRYAKYYSRTEHLMIPEILVFSKRLWEQLSKRIGT